MSKIQAVQAALKIPGMTTENELSFLYDLALKARDNSQFVELGTYLGRTLSVLASVARDTDKQLFSLDNYSYDGKCSLAGVRNNLIQAGFNSQLEANKIVLLEKDSREVPEGIRDIGLLFIDSDHFKHQFDAEMSVWLEYITKGSIIVCHDYDSPTWLEMTDAINRWFMNLEYKNLGLVRRMIAFKKIF